MDFRHFLNLNSDRQEFTEPFVFQGQTIAANNVSMICFKSDKKYQKISENNQWMVAFLTKAFKALEKNKNNASPLPKIKIPKPDECDECKGTGLLIQRECHECDAEGIVFWETKYNNYSATCLSCYGEGEITIAGRGENCIYCNGLKTRFYTQYPTYIEGLKIDMALLYPIKDIPGLKVAVPDHKKELLFYGDNCSGLVMGMREMVEIDEF